MTWPGQSWTCCFNLNSWKCISDWIHSSSSLFTHIKNVWVMYVFQNVYLNIGAGYRVHTGLTSSRFHVRLRSAFWGSRLSGARGRSSTDRPFISGVLVCTTGGIFRKFKLSSKTRSTNYKWWDERVKWWRMEVSVTAALLCIVREN